jgi:hypothetical protein
MTTDTAMALVRVPAWFARGRNISLATLALEFLH